jgi:hypothetical protein
MTKPWFCLDCRMLMDNVDEDHCKCPRCGTEVWYNYGETSPAESQKVEVGLTRNSYISRSLPEGNRVPPGGAKAGKRPKKKGTKIYIDNGYEAFLK